MAPEPVPDVVIESIRPDEIDTVSRLMPWRQGARHAERALGQRSGRAVYLLAWANDVPIGHSFVKWPGDLSSRQARAKRCAEVEDLFVVPEERNRGIGTALLISSEVAARAEGHDLIGLAVALDNEGARRLYARHGYRDAGQGVFTLRWTSLDDDGIERTWREQCTYLMKRL
jgi:GNAT superfamily N-acetyltransferase